MKFVIKSFTELTTKELYQILQLRAAVFVVEQDCVYLDTDFKDLKALHIIGFKNNSLVAYARIFKPEDYFKNASIGRVVVKKEYRKLGIGNKLIQTAICTIKNTFKVHVITISAQLYLLSFYEKNNFKKVSNVYLEDGIPHIKMTCLL